MTHLALHTDIYHAQPFKRQMEIDKVCSNELWICKQSKTINCSISLKLTERGVNKDRSGIKSKGMRVMI